jgi:hypothetical protein
VEGVCESIEKDVRKHEEDIRSKRESLKQLMNVREATERGTARSRVRSEKQLKYVK